MKVAIVLLTFLVVHLWKEADPVAWPLQNKQLFKISFTPCRFDLKVGASSATN